MHVLKPVRNLTNECSTTHVVHIRVGQGDMRCDFPDGCVAFFRMLVILNVLSMIPTPEMRVGMTVQLTRRAF
jgi:hypothetical protein